MSAAAAFDAALKRIYGPKPQWRADYRTLLTIDERARYESRRFYRLGKPARTAPQIASAMGLVVRDVSFFTEFAYSESPLFGFLGRRSLEPSDSRLNSRSYFDAGKHGDRR